MSTAVVHDPIILNNRPLSANSAYHTVLLKLKWWIRTVCAVDLPSNAGRKGTETRLTEAEHNKEPLRNFFVKVKKGKLVGAKRQRGFLLWTCSDESQACPHAKRPLTSASFPAVKAVTSQLRSKQLAMLTEEEREQVKGLCNGWEDVQQVVKQLEEQLGQRDKEHGIKRGEFKRQLDVTDDDLKRVSFLLMGQQTDGFHAQQIRAWMLFNVSDCSCSTRLSVLRLEHILQCKVADAAAGGLPELTILVQTAESAFQASLVRHHDPSLCPLGALGVHLWGLSQIGPATSGLVLFPLTPDVEAPSAPGPKPKEDPTRAVEASNIHRSLGDEANKAWQQVVAGSKSAFSSILSQLTTNRLDNAGVPPQVMGKYLGTIKGRPHATEPRIVQALGGWDGTAAAEPPRFYIEVSEQLLDGLLSARPELQSGNTALSDPLLGPARTAYRSLVSMAVQDMVAMQSGNAEALVGHPFCQALMQQPETWSTLQESYAEAQADAAPAAAQRSSSPEQSAQSEADDRHAACKRQHDETAQGLSDLLDVAVQEAKRYRALYYLAMAKQAEE